MYICDLFFLSDLWLMNRLLVTFELYFQIIKMQAPSFSIQTPPNFLKIIFFCLMKITKMCFFLILFYF